MNDGILQGKFKKFGLPNYTAEEVQKFLDICEEQGYTKPNVYEGHYNAIIAAATILEFADKNGISGHAAAIRWTAFHSELDVKHGDSIIFWVSKIEQLHRTLDAFEAGPRSTDLAEAITDIY
ncbi:hypothetical protein DM02DRAFT_657464 [Periconia macrospinosa]|uniref:Uncharacterized protein n=1 Tax=Periconia macrospinosa TaxID=97972 RepID=A0A2V1DJI0_9PLEO|nr:hypothetical protein DM02DRAFT_657464 [Periconia macrospinosa]